MNAYADTIPPVLGEIRHACRFCSLHEFCWPLGLDLEDLQRLRAIVRRGEALPAGSVVFRVGDQFTAIYAVCTGCIKSCSVDAGGHELVHGFHLRGELFGFDAVYPDQHRCNAQVLEATSLCVLPYIEIDRLSAELQSLHARIRRLMSREFSRQRMCGAGFGAKQRVAAFLINIYTRLRRPESAQYQFRLPMSREDIASYLSISAETLSRQLAKLQRMKLIGVDRRNIRLIDPTRLGLVAQGVS